MAPKITLETQEVDKKSTPSWKKAAAGFIALASINTLTACEDKAGAEPDAITPPTPEQTTSAPVTPGETEYDVETTEPIEPVETETEATIAPEEAPISQEPEMSYEEIVASLEIEAGLSPEEYAERFIDNLAGQNLAGVNEELWERTFGDDNVGIEETLSIMREHATTNIDQLVEATFSPDEDNPNKSSLMEVRGKLIDRATTLLYQWGVNHNREGKPDYRMWMEVNEVETLLDAAGYRHLVIHITDYNNYDEVYVDSVDAEAVHGLNGKVEILTQKKDGKERVFRFF